MVFFNVSPFEELVTFGIGKLDNAGSQSVCCGFKLSRTGGLKEKGGNNFAVQDFTVRLFKLLPSPKGWIFFRVFGQGNSNFYFPYWLYL